MASGYKYQETPIEDFLSDPGSFPGLNSNHKQVWADSNKYAPALTATFVKQNCLNNNIYASVGCGLQNYFVGSNLANLARKGSCPIPFRNIFSTLSFNKSVGKFKYAEIDGKYGCLLLDYSTSGNIRYSETDNSLQIFDDANSNWIDVPNSSKSNIVLIELVGAGGGGGGNGIDYDATNENDVTGGGGGGGGSFISVMADVSYSRIEHLTFFVGSGGDGGIGIEDGDGTGGHGGDGGATQLWRSNERSEIICQAPGGYGGKGGRDSDSGAGYGGEGGGTGDLKVTFSAAYSKDSSEKAFIAQVAWSLGKSGGNGGSNVDSDYDNTKKGGSAGDNFASSTDLIVSYLATSSYDLFGGMPGDPYYSSDSSIKAISTGGGGGSSAYGRGRWGATIGATPPPADFVGPVLTSIGRYPLLDTDAGGGIGGGGGGGAGWRDGSEPHGTVGYSGNDGAVIIYYELS